jgi:hypothetical protein
MQTPTGPVPPPAKGGIVKPLLIGCGVVFVVLVIAGGIGAWFITRAVGTAFHQAGSVAQVAQGAMAGAEKEAQQSGASPGPAQGVAMLKSLVGGGNGHIQTLSRQDLQAYLPASLGSLARTNAQSSSGSVGGISGTSASATYGGGDGTVTLDLTDAANMAGLATLMGVAMSVEREDDAGYEKNVQVGNVSVHEKWENAGKHAELIGIVGNRFVVNVESNGVDANVDEGAFQAIDTAKLASIAAAATPEPAASP